VLGGAVVVAQDEASPGQPDLVVGAWQLDAAKSHYSPGPAPLREIRTYEHEHEGIRVTIHTTDARGQERMIEYAASYNDVVAIVTGSDQTDAITMRRINDTTARATLSYQGRVVGTAERVIAPDGQSMTITFKREAPTPIENVAVYRRVTAN
jgi:hypothetical protein